MEQIIAGVTASLLTLFDLDRTFYVPAAVQRKAALYAWWWSFILANGGIAAGLYLIVNEIDALQKLPPVLRAVAVGMSYLAILRSKFTTFPYQGRDVPFGFEIFYEGAKGFVYKRINKIAKAARYDETTNMANSCTLAELGSRTGLSINQDALLSNDEKKAAKAWLLRVLQDTNATDFDKRAALADFILSGQRSGDFT